ncbi:MAG: amino acid transporter [Burkholderiaceae bacterium]|jgi:L-lysine exporter family protein LysE/ArgO|nr:amino acid transporter [Burkholderiaceae bacterium]MCB1987314.1 amino acid transporter [Burkholderiaceae bacterium]
MTQTWTVLAQGFSSTAVLIVAIGAQNAFVLRQGLRREHIMAVVAVCALSDAVLINVGVWGMGTAAATHPALALGARVFGALYLIVYAWRSLQRAWSPQALAVDAAHQRTPLAQVLGTTFALTWLNPHVYLDTVLLLGSMASPFAGMERAAFAAGASLASAVWFTTLGWGARWLAPLFATPQAWRILDAGIALLMLGLAALLLRPAG